MKDDAPTHEYVLIFQNGTKRNITKKHKKLIMEATTMFVELEKGEYYVNKDQIVEIKPIEFE